MRRVVVTGGAGFIGSHICDALVDRGDEVVCIDNLLTGRLSNIEHLVDHARFSFVEANVIDSIPVDGSVDLVMHLASPASPPEYLKLPFETLDVSSVGTRRALDLALERNARFFVASTSEVYGDPLVHPQTEDYWGNVNPIGPRSIYDEAKRFTETLTMAYHRYHGVSVGIARIFNTYGPRLRPADGRVVSNFLMQAKSGAPLTIYGEGTQTRSFCYVSDEVRGLLALADSDVTGPVNIGNPDEFTMLELAEVVVEVTGSKSDIVFEPLPADDPSRRKPDISLALRLLGWAPTVDLREGLRLTYESYNANNANLGLEPISYKKLSVVVPVFNERNTVVEILRRMRAVELPAGLDLEILIIDDGSTDGTREVLRQLGDSTVRIVLQPRNAGKGAAVREGFSQATGDMVLVQDADLEYDPDDWPRLINPVLRGKALVVYGSRFTGERRNMLFLHWMGNRFLSLMTNVLYNTTLSDMETCYKLLDRRVLDSLTLRSNRFEIEPEITAKILKQGIRIYEVPISYAGREFDEGKKITWRDGFSALGTLVKYRFTD